MTKIFACLWTRARNSLISPPNVIGGFPHINQATDFYPGFGSFSTSMYGIPIQIGSLNLDVVFGVLPTRLQATLLGDWAEGILGSDLLRRFKIYFALPQDAIGLLPY
jgi:hypothetical protein